MSHTGMSEVGLEQSLAGKMDKGQNAAKIRR
jgi:hypothetical protein